MIVAAGQLAQLPVEALAAGVVLARLAPAVAAPVAEGFDEGLEQRVVGEHRAAFAHGDVVRGIKADRGEVAEGADHLAVVRCAQGVAAVFDQPEVVLLAKAVTASRSKGLPSVWAIMTARVRSVSAASSWVASTL